MSHECEYCGVELTSVDSWGIGYWYRDGNPEGEILQCPNHEGFDTEEEARTYLTSVDALDSFWEKHFDCEDVMCESNCHSVSGMYYTDRNGELHQGYPC